jgi:hypothetical protein
MRHHQSGATINSFPLSKSKQTKALIKIIFLKGKFKKKQIAFPFSIRKVGLATLVVLSKYESLP